MRGVGQDSRGWPGADGASSFFVRFGVRDSDDGLGAASLCHVLAETKGVGLGGGLELGGLLGEDIELGLDADECERAPHDA